MEELLWKFYYAGFDIGISVAVEWKDLSKSEKTQRAVHKFEALLQEGGMKGVSN